MNTNHYVVHGVGGKKNLPPSLTSSRSSKPGLSSAFVILFVTPVTAGQFT